MRGGTLRLLAAWCVLGAACRAEIGVGGKNNEVPDGASIDPDAEIGIDAPIDAAPLGPWGAPARVPGASSNAGEDDGSLSSTTNELVFSFADPNANNAKDLYYMSRSSPADPWSAPTRLPFNVTASDETPRFSPDDLTLYFASARNGGPGGLDIYRVTRAQVGGAWSTPQLVPGVSTSGVDKWYAPCAVDGSYLTILGQNIGAGSAGNPPTVVAALSSQDGTETGTFLSPDCLTVYFASTRSGTNQMYRSTRAAIGAAWAAPARVTDFDALGGAQEDPWLSSDLRTFAFVSDVRGSKDVYISTR